MPDEFLEICETILLEPKAQAMPEARNTASTSQTPIGATVNESYKQGKTKDVTTFPIPQGSKVGNIKMVFLDEQTVRITIQDKSEVFNFAQMGFFSKKSAKPNKLWTELAIYVDGNGITGQKDSERINNTLQAFFKTEQKLLNKNRTFFKISKQTISNNKITQQGKAMSVM